MSAGAIIIIVIATSGVLMMRFRKRWLAKINIAFTNRITGLFAGWLLGEEFLALRTLLPLAGCLFKPCALPPAKQCAHRRTCHPIEEVGIQGK